MRKEVSLASIVCAVLLLFSVNVVRPDVKASPAIIRVPTDYPSIQEAINAANAGDTILVESGRTYLENVVVNKTLTLAGEKKESTIINGGKKGPTIKITANTVSVKDFTIRNGTYNVYLYYSRGNMITSNIIDDGTGGSGILLENSRSNTIINNTVNTAGESGIYLYYSNDNVVSRNNSTNNIVGIWVSHSKRNTITSNNVTKNSYGVWLGYSESNTLRENSITSNTYNFGVDGTILAEFIQDLDLSNKVDGKPICYWVNQQNKQVPENAGYAAAVNSTNITAKNLRLENNREGVLLAYTINSTIESNTIANSSEHAISLYNSHGNTIKSNAVTVAKDGILLDNSNNNIVNNNTTTECTEYGVWLASSTGNTISSNNVFDNWIGAILYSSSSNTLYSNNIARNTYGIWLSSSNNNKIYHNNFDNSNQVQSRGGSVNLWDNGYSSDGNYWSNYGGFDIYWGSYQNKIGSDGIGDTPFVIDSNNQDKYPLMSPYEYWINPIIGDINKDTRVNTIDLSQLARAYGSTPEKPNWHPNSDLNSDNLVDIQDLFGVGKNYGKTNS